MPVNGKVYDWESITIALPYGVVIGVESIDYDDGKEAELVYGKGGKALGYGRGNYEANAKMSMLRDEFDRLLEYAKEIGKALYALPPFPITVSYANDGAPTKTDVIKGAKLTKNAHKAAQGDKKLSVDLELLVTDQIVRDGVRAV